MRLKKWRKKVLLEKICLEDGDQHLQTDYSHNTHIINLIFINASVLRWEILKLEQKLKNVYLKLLQSKKKCDSHHFYCKIYQNSSLQDHSQDKLYISLNKHSYFYVFHEYFCSSSCSCESSMRLHCIETSH
jgi:hypothetical protein